MCVLGGVSFDDWLLLLLLVVVVVYLLDWDGFSGLGGLHGEFEDFE